RSSLSFDRAFSPRNFDELASACACGRARTSRRYQMSRRRDFWSLRCSSAPPVLQPLSAVEKIRNFEAVRRPEPGALRMKPHFAMLAHGSVVRSPTLRTHHRGIFPVLKGNNVTMPVVIELFAGFAW